MRLPPAAQWDKRIDGLEDTRKLCADYERSLLPPGTAVPRVGQVWETVRDCEVDFIAWFAFGDRGAAQGGRARLPQGERVRIRAVDDTERPLQVTSVPLRYEALHASIVPDEIRRAPGYMEFSLVLRTARTICCWRGEPGYFNELFILVEDVA